MRFFKPLFPLLTTLTLFVHAQSGINQVSANADSVILQFMSDWNISSAGVAITKNGKLIYNKGLGYTDARKTRKAQPGNLYRIASVSKPITAIAIMKLVEDGHLSLSDTVFGKGKLIDQSYYLKMVSDRRIYNITVQQLLEHTAGWDRDKGVDGYPHSDAAFFPMHVASVMNEPNPVGDSTLIKFMLYKGLNNAPGTHYSYSNVGYLILGKIIEKVSGMKYEAYVREKIFKPLKINSIQLGKNLFENKKEKEVEYLCDESSRSCYGDGKWVKNPYGSFNLEAMNAHGGWIASAADLTKLMLAVDGFSTSPDILKPATLGIMNTPSVVNPYYAKGWSANSRNNFWHTGSIDGSATFVCRTSDGYTWAFLFNSRADNSSAFWNAFDKLPRKCIKAMTETVVASNGFLKTNP